MNRPRPHRSRRPRGRGGHRPDRLRPVPRRRPAAVGQRPLQGRRRLPLDRQRSASPRASTRSRRRTSRSAPARPASCSRPTATATIRLQTTAKGGKPLFVGVARTRDVDAYLRGVSHSEVSDIDYAPFSARYAARTAARASPARPPRSASGPPPAPHVAALERPVRRLVGRGHERRRLARRRRRRQRRREGPLHRRVGYGDARRRPAVHHRHRRADRLRHRAPVAPARSLVA